MEKAYGTKKTGSPDGLTLT